MVRNIITKVVVSDCNPWRVLRRAEYHSSKNSPLASDLYVRFSQLMGAKNQHKPEDMSLRDYIIKLATSCDTNESKALKIVLNRKNASAIDRWYESMDLSGLYSKCFEDREYEKIQNIAYRYADTLLSNDSPNENIEEFSNRLFNDIATTMDADMKSDINLRKAIQSENLMSKLEKMIANNQ